MISPRCGFIWQALVAGIGAWAFCFSVTFPARAAHEIRLAEFSTPILAADAGRVQNIALAVRKINGTIIRPGESFSFNQTVGPRDAQHGWAPAAELYQGEFVMGYGGGICQVSSTLYNAVLLAGLPIAERHHHDRPLEYVAPGRDATVVWNLLDFRFRNTTGAPVRVVARLLPGEPQRVEVAVTGPAPRTPQQIQIEASDLRYLPPELVEIVDPTLNPNQRVVADEGAYGLEVSIHRIFRGPAGERRELVSHDQYPPKPGKVRIGPKTD